MPLAELWKSNPQAIEQFSIEQIVKIAGDGNLRDDSACSKEFREYLTQLPDSSPIREYISQCLSAGFQKSGVVLQDLVNELGRRLDYDVVNGRYQGTVGRVGFDGIWTFEDHTIIVEVKTTDAYRISLDTIAKYRDKLRTDGRIGIRSSILIVVGREDTGELESQVRGSRHAWDIRLISADALGKLVKMKEEAEGIETSLRIRNLLIPREYTRLDELIEVMFTTAQGTVDAITSPTAPDSEPVPESTPAPAPPNPTGKAWEFTDQKILRSLRARIITSLAIQQSEKFQIKSGALYWNDRHDARVACTMSKRYTSSSGSSYWYGYHRDWDNFLQQGKSSTLALGCVGAPFAFAIPWVDIHSLLPYLNKTEKSSDNHYWHLRLLETPEGHFRLLLEGGSGAYDMDRYKMQLS
jgi:hypothetical protein